ncbi:UPF0261-domain-containing protein [Rhizodiscina lignyota]|uniref:UPF0261-domain-containing protein n=1 Tax=Rhizodiscina lignyota TaxID=1504668 RepID=A0A9P4ILK8_9PEZI|nr:UPF0261-domain-containing protein [Rhizodiscina lignyota]
MAPLNILLLGTCDTKLPELLYLRSQILELSTEPSTNVILIDVGRTPVFDPSITVSQSHILEALKRSDPSSMAINIASAPRGELIAHLAAAAAAYIRSTYTTSTSTATASADDKQIIHGIVAAGGSGNTSLVSQVMRSEGLFPIGFPKLIVSTIASGDTSHVVGESDITLTYSVVDVAGLNTLLKSVLSNAAGAIVGMAKAYKRRIEAASREQSGRNKKVKMGITMFGVTTPCVDHVRAIVEEKHPDIEPYVFHATGHGGRAMEALVHSHDLDAVLDLTTTEIADHLVGGVMSAGPERLDAALQRGIPCLISVGACDMVNFGPVPSVPGQFAGGKRQLFEHNQSVTLMRTSEEECEKIGQFIVEKVKRAKRKDLVEVWIPKLGVSALSVEGQAFEDQDADSCLFAALGDGLQGVEGVKVVSRAQDINQESFANAVVEAMVGLIEKARSDSSG